MRLNVVLASVALAALSSSSPCFAETAGLAPSPAANARPLSEVLTGEALADYEAARLLYRDRDYAGASLKFEQAYERSREPRLLWNSAVAQKQLRRYAKLQRLIRRYLAEGGTKLSEADRREAEGLLEASNGFVSELKVRSNVASARLIVDEEELGTTNDAPLVDMGLRRVRVEAPSHEPYSALVEVAGGRPHELEVRLEPAVLDGRVRIVADSAATIQIDKKTRGVGEWEGRLPAGRHELVVTARGRRPYSTSLLVHADQTLTQRISLESEPIPLAQERSTIWPWVASGAALATALGVGAYFLFRAEDDPNPPAGTPGTLSPGLVPVSGR